MQALYDDQAGVLLRQLIPKIIFENSLLGTSITRKNLYISLKPAIATCQNVARADSIFYFLQVLGIT